MRWSFEEDPEKPGLAETTALIEQAVRDLEAQGAEVVDVPLTREFVEGTLQSGGWMDMRPSIDRFLRETPATWPARVAARTDPADVLSFADVMADRPSALTDGDIAYFLSHRDVPNPDYEKAIAEQDAGKAAMDAFFVEHGVDALAMPTSATSATPTWAGTTFCDIGANTGIPSISVPAGFTSTGAPVGLEPRGPAQPRRRPARHGVRVRAGDAAPGRPRLDAGAHGRRGRGSRCRARGRSRGRRDDDDDGRRDRIAGIRPAGRRRRAHRRRRDQHARAERRDRRSARPRRRRGRGRRRPAPPPVPGSRAG
ncbi:amidase family protein [Clavibacter tessellarius]|uniref:amidase family protein n=1 Tax=Clavibacter tessellarius TaxID=31965 RepID=UPI00324B6088